LISKLSFLSCALQKCNKEPLGLDSTLCSPSVHIKFPMDSPTYSQSSQCLGNVFPIALHFFVLYNLPHLLSSWNPHRVGEYWDLYDSMFRNTFFFFGGHEPIKEAHLQEKFMDMEGHPNFLISFTLSMYMDINSTLVDLFYTYI